MLMSWPLAGFNQWEQQANRLGEILLPSKRWSTSRTDLTFSPLPVVKTRFGATAATLWWWGNEPKKGHAKDSVAGKQKDTGPTKSPRHPHRNKAQLLKPWWGLFVTCHQTNSQPALTAALNGCLWVLGTNVQQVLRMWPSLAPDKTPA